MHAILDRTSRPRTNMCDTCSLGLCFWGAVPTPQPRAIMRSGALNELARGFNHRLRADGWHSQMRPLTFAGKVTTSDEKNSGNGKARGRSAPPPTERGAIVRGDRRHYLTAGAR